jgi:hypothetical protein
MIPDLDEFLFFAMSLGDLFGAIIFSLPWEVPAAGAPPLQGNLA